jgi:hypothetical protein
MGSEDIFREFSRAVAFVRDLLPLRLNQAPFLEPRPISHQPSKHQAQTSVPLLGSLSRIRHTPSHSNNAGRTDGNGDCGGGGATYRLRAG